MTWNRIILCGFFILCACTFPLWSETLPDWVTDPPTDDSHFIYFTGQGFDAGKNTNEARERAVDDLVGGIMRFVGVRVHSEVNTDAVATADSFESELRKTVTQSGSARVTGFQIIHEWAYSIDAGTTVYLLARYKRSDLLREKNRLEKLFQETIDAVAVPESDGYEYYRTGQYYEALVRFLEATLAAAESNLENKNIYVNRNIDNAMRALERLNLYKLNNNLIAYVGQEIKEPFSVKVAEGPLADTPGVNGVALQFSYKRMKNSRKQTETSVLKTDKQGVAAFTHPVSRFVGREQVTVTLSLAAYLKKLDGLPHRYESKLDGLKRLAVSKKVVFDFSVLSRAADIPIGIVIADLDKDERVTGGSGKTASGVMEVLTQNGFDISIIPIKPSLILSKNDAEILRLVKANAGKTGRVIYGSARAGEPRKSGSRYIVRVMGTIKVLDLDSGKIVFEKTVSKNGLGGSPQAAQDAAFKLLGRELGKSVAAGVK